MVGALGAFLVALAIRAALIVQVKQLSALMVVCMVAGVSERLVPNFVEQIESRSVSRKPDTNTQPTPEQGGE